MRHPYDIDRDAAREAGAVRAIVASLCVIGLASIMWVHSGVPGQPEDTAPTAAAATAFLPAPATPAESAQDFGRPTQADVDPAPPPTF